MPKSKKLKSQKRRVKKSRDNKRKDSGFFYDSEEEKQQKKILKRQQEIQNLLCTDDKLPWFSSKKRGTPGQCFKKGFITSFVTDFSKNVTTPDDNLTSEERESKKLFKRKFSNQEMFDLIEQYSVNGKFPIRLDDNVLRDNINRIFNKNFTHDEIKKLMADINDKFPIKRLDQELKELHDEIDLLKTQLQNITKQVKNTKP